LRVFERGDHNSILAENEAEYRSAVTEFLGKIAMRGPAPGSGSSSPAR
jgi:hypothetical protein